MQSIRKKIVTDERLHPIAVQIDYEDWLEIEKMIFCNGSQCILPPVI